VEATVCFNYSMSLNMYYHQCSIFVIIKPSVIPVVSFAPFPSSSWSMSNFSMSVLKRIDKANYYQSAIVSVTLSLSNGTDVEISTNKNVVISTTQSPTSPIFHRLVTSNSDSGPVLVLDVTPSVSGPITSAVTVTVKAIFAKLTASTGQQKITISPSSADVTEMQVSIPSHLDGFSTQKFFVDILPVLDENCNGIPCKFTTHPRIQPNWIVMSSSQPWAIAVNNTDWSLVLLGNTVNKALITISVMDVWAKPAVARLSVQYSVSSNLMTSLGCSDLGYKSGPPLIIFNETMLQVWYNSPVKIGTVTLGVHIW